MSTSDERGRVAKDKTLSHKKQVEMAKALKEAGKANKDIAYIMRISESTVRILLTPPEIKEEEIIWFPGIYGGRTEEPWTTKVADISLVDLTKLVQKRAEEDSQFAIDNDLVGDNSDKMVRMRDFVADAKNIHQCVGHILKEKSENVKTVDWVCRELANASKWMVR